MSAVMSPDAQLAEEERIVAELEQLGVTYLSRREAQSATETRPPEKLLADLSRQPSARVREAIIALLLAHPEYAAAVPVALNQLTPAEQTTLRVFYTAAVLLQQEYAEQLHPYLVARWQPLPDLFSTELGLPHRGSHRERLTRLDHTHRRLSGAAVNWAGTYENVVRHLVRRWELEYRGATVRLK